MFWENRNVFIIFKNQLGMKTKPITVEGLREKLRYHEEFDVCFAGPLTGVYDRMRSFYEEMGNLQLPYQKRLFIPCINSPKGKRLEKIEDIILKIIVPSSDLVLCFAEQDFNPEIAGLKSTTEFGGKMVDCASKHEIPVAHLIKGRVGDDYLRGLIGFKEDSEVFAKIDAFLRNFYRNSKLY